MGVKSRGLTSELHSILLRLSTGEEAGIYGVAVKCVDIVRNISGEGESLNSMLTLRHESQGSKRD